MAKYDAFNPQGALFHILAATTGPTPVQLFSSSTLNPIEEMEISNAGSVDAFLCFSTTSAGASAVATAGIPAAGNSQSGMLHIPAGSDKIYSIRSDMYFTAITGSSTADLYAVAGRGQ